MEENSTAIGVSLICGGLLIFAMSYCLLVKKQQHLLGNITKLWFRALTWGVAAGLLLLVLDSLRHLLFVALFWRH